MVELTDREQEWLKDYYPNLSYNKKRGIISGEVNFYLRYKNCPSIKDSYNIKIDLSQMHDRSDFPKVYNTDNRISKIAERKQKSKADLHLYMDNSLCMILTQKIKISYPFGFRINDFMRHLKEHLYWISYYERYDKEAWLPEKHGQAAVIDYNLGNDN